MVYITTLLCESITESDFAFECPHIKLRRWENKKGGKILLVLGQVDSAHYFHYYGEVLKVNTVATGYSKRHVFKYISIFKIDFLCQI